MRDALRPTWFGEFGESGAEAPIDWLSLLPYATPDERRTLLDSEHAAAAYAGALHARGERVAFERFAEVHSEPARMLA